MPNVPIQVVGTTYSSRSAPVAAQVTRNFRIEASQFADNQAVLIPFPGCKLFSDTPGQSSRGIGTYKNELYAVVGADFYKISSSGAQTYIGQIAGQSRAVMAEDTDNLVITAASGKPYSYDGASLVSGTDTDLYSSATVTYLNNRVIYDGEAGNIIFADLGDPLVVDASNVTSSDSKPDDTEAVFSFKDQVFVFGQRSIVPFYNSGAGSPPYSVVQNGISDIGTPAKYSIASNYRAMYFLGSDLNVYRITGFQPEPVGNPSICEEIRSYGNVSAAYGVCFTLESQNYYLLSFPGHATWLYCEGLGWTNLANGVHGEPHLIYDYAYCYDKHLIQSRIDGSIYELCESTYQDAGGVIDRLRDTIKISGKDFGAPGKEIYMHSLELVVETGSGLITGQGENPKVMMSFSDDGGRTFSEEQWVSFGRMGEFTYSINPKWHHLGSFYERQFRFRCSDPVKFVIISANADIEIAP